MTRASPRGRDAYRHFTTITTRWADNDAYGHVNNSVFYLWFDTAVNQWLIDRGLLDIANGDPIGLVVETGCRYFAPLTFPGDIEVGIVVEHIGTTSVTYTLGIFASGCGEAAAQGHFIHVYVDRSSRRPLVLPTNWRTALADLN